MNRRKWQSTHYTTKQCRERYCLISSWHQRRIFQHLLLAARNRNMYVILRVPLLLSNIVSQLNTKAQFFTQFLRQSWRSCPADLLSNVPFSQWWPKAACKGCGAPATVGTSWCFVLDSLLCRQQLQMEDGRRHSHMHACTHTQTHTLRTPQWQSNYRSFSF